MRMLVRFALLLGSLVVAVCPARAQTTIFFDNMPGASEFSVMGSNWSGGKVLTEGIFALYASGSFSYEINRGGGRVTFDRPVTSARFFYVHGFGFAAGTATAFDGANNSLMAVSSRAATSFADPNNFVVLEPAAPIARIEFSAGVIDNFTFTTASPPSPTPTPTPTQPVATATPPATPTPTQTPGLGGCVGDCNHDRDVTVDELITGVNIALGNAPLDACAQFDSSGDGQVTIDELIAAVNLALNGCVTA